MKIINDDKAIICSDLHVREYTEYNPNETQLKYEKINPLGIEDPSIYRLNQIMMIALRIIYECKKYKTKTVFILGDLSDKPRATPLVINTLKSMIKAITNEEITIYYILGQHDNLTRKTDPNIRKDTYIGTLRNSHFIYSHGKQYKMGKQIIEFKNFDFDNECSFKDDSTVLLGHISLGMGQSPKGKSAKICIAGDIHDLIDQTINGIECHSCATPFVIYPHQSMNGYIGLLDCSKDKPTYERISTSGKIEYENKILDFELFDILKSDDYRKATIEKQFDELMEEQTSIEEVDTSNFDIGNIENAVKEIAKENDFEDLFSELLLDEMPKPIDFNFKLETLDIENVRSINKLHLDFNNLKGITYLNGTNGSGKSSIITAIETALIGNSRIKKLIRKDQKDLCLDLVLTYKKHEYEIIRKSSKTSFYIDGEEYKKGKKETEQKIFEELPFLNYLDYFICHANSHFFDNVDRTELIMNLFNLNSLNYYRESIEDLQDRLKEDIKEETINKSSYENQLTDLKEDKENIKNKISELSSGDFKQISDAKNKLKEFNDLLTEIKSSMTLCNSYKTSINQLKESVDKNSDELKYNNAIDILKQYDAIEELKNTINKQESSIRLLKNELNSIVSIRQKLVNTPKCKCPECEHEFYLDDNIDEKLKEYNIEISQKQSEISVKESELKFISESLPKLELELSKKDCEEIINKYKASKQLLEQLSNLEEKYSLEKKKGSENYTIKQALLDSNGFKDDKEYIDALNTSIEYQIKKDSYDEELKNVKEKISKYKDKLENSNSKIEKLNSKYTRSEKFRSLFDMKNLDSIPYKMIDSILHSLDNDNIRFTSTKELSNGDERFEINVEIKVGDNFIDYENSSDGQKVILDSFILLSILKNLKKVGLIILDEYSANSDSDNVEIVSHAIKYMKKFTRNLVVTSHSDYFNGFDHQLSLKLKNGITECN